MQPAAVMRCLLMILEKLHRGADYFEKDVFDQSLVNVGVDKFARAYDFL